MTKPRLHILLSDEVAKLLEGACIQTGATKTALVEAAIKELLGQKSETRELEKMRFRLDKMSKALDRLAGDAEAHTETLALYVLYYLCITPPLPESSRASCEALGRKRFERFVGQVGDRLKGKDSFAGALLDHMGLERVEVPQTAAPETLEPKIVEAVQ